MRAPRYAETVTGKLRHIGENDMTRLLASLFIATSLLAVASSEASAWVCLAAGAGSSAYGRDYYNVVDARAHGAPWMRTSESDTDLYDCVVPAGLAVNRRSRTEERLAYSRLLRA